MKITNNDRRKVSILANKLHNEKDLSLSEAFKKAWKVIKLKKQMQTGVAEFTYTKKDGTLRNAKGTIQAEAINYTRKTNKVYSSLYVRYFDLDKNAFRQFAAERIA